MILVKYMIQKNIKITKDYFSLIKFKNKYLITFIFIDLINELLSLSIPYFISQIIDTATNCFYNLAIIYTIILGTTYFFNKIGSYCTNWCYANFFKEEYINVHTKLVNSIYNFDEEYSKKLSIGKIINSSNTDIINIAEIPSLIIELAIKLLKIGIIYIVFAKENILIAFYVIIINGVYYNLAKKCNNKNVYYSKKQRQYADQMTGMLSQILTGLKDIKSFNISNNLNKKLDIYRNKWKQSYFLKRKYYFSRKTIVAFINDFGKTILYLILIISIMHGKMKIATLLLFTSYYDKVKESINDIMSFDASIMEEAVSLYRIKEITNYKNNNKMPDGSIDNVINGLIEFKNVSFKYKQNIVLENISFIANPNQITVIIGKTGAGKTTILNLIMKRYKIEHGNILIDNLDIYKYQQNTYNNNISVVNQNTFIFNMSISDNLSLVNPNRKKQIDICKKVGIHDFIISLPKGYNTILKENATSISGGQKQLLSLARALLSETKIILLDEITSALDSNTTNQIIKLLKELKKNHTLLLITHNKEVMKIADKIIFLNNGKIQYDGNYKKINFNDK